MSIFSYLTFCIIFFLPTVLSYLFSYDKDLTWLIASSVFLFSVSCAVFSLISYFSNKRLIQLVFSAPFLLAIYLFEILQSISYYLQGYGFNARFFHHFSVNTIKLAWSGHPEIPLFIISFLGIFIFLIYLCIVNNIFYKFRIPFFLFAMFSIIYLDYLSIGLRIPKFFM